MNRKIYLTALLLLLLTPAALAQSHTVNIGATLIKTDPVPVESGEDADVFLKIRNTGGTGAENVTVDLLDSYPFQIKPDQRTRYSLGTITPGEEYHISTEILIADDAPDGQNELDIRLHYGDLSVTRSIPLTVQSRDTDLQLANLETTPGTLMPDTDNNELSVDIVNNGDKEAENVVLDLALPPAFRPISSFSSRQALGSVGAGETKTGTFTFDINETAAKGPVQLNGTLSYSANGSSGRIREDVSFQVYLSGAPQYELVDISSDLRVGATDQVRVTVRNSGSERSTSTRVRVLDSADLPFSYESSSAFIGSLDPGETGTAVFDTTVEKDAPSKEYLLDFEVRGVDDTQVFVDEKTASIGVTASEKTTGQGIDPLLVVAVAELGIILLLLGIILRERRKGVEDNES